MFWSLHYPTWTGISSSLGFPRVGCRMGDPHGGFHYWWTSSRRWWNHNQSWHGRNRSTPQVWGKKIHEKVRKWSFWLRCPRFLTHRILLSVEASRPNPSFSGNLSSISKHRNSSLVNTQFGSFAHKSHFIFPISPWSLDFPQKQGVIFFPLQSITLLWN